MPTECSCTHILLNRMADKSIFLNGPMIERYYSKNISPMSWKIKIMRRQSSQEQGCVTAVSTQSSCHRHQDSSAHHCVRGGVCLSKATSHKVSDPSMSNTSVQLFDSSFSVQRLQTYETIKEIGDG